MTQFEELFISKIYESLHAHTPCLHAAFAIVLHSKSFAQFNPAPIISNQKINIIIKIIRIYIYVIILQYYISITYIYICSNLLLIVIIVVIYQLIIMYTNKKPLQKKQN